MNLESIDLSSPLVMGILNVTPDSFYDGGSNDSPTAIRNHIEAMLKAGAGIIDIGAYSSRPGAEDVSPQEEFNRLKVALEIIRTHFPETIVSIDTFRLDVIKTVVDFFGDVIINDISGGEYDADMIAYSAKQKLPYICMHMQGTPKTMQEKPHYDNVVTEVLAFFDEKIKEAESYGLKQFIVDPGFGFGKTVEQNYTLFNHLEDFVALKYPVLVGISHKSMIQKVLDCSTKEALNGTTILNTIALLKGAKILRVHEVKEAIEVVKIVKKFQ